MIGAGNPKSDIKTAGRDFEANLVRYARRESIPAASRRAPLRNRQKLLNKPV